MGGGLPCISFILLVVGLQSLVRGHWVSAVQSRVQVWAWVWTGNCVPKASVETPGILMLAQTTCPLVNEAVGFVQNWGWLWHFIHVFDSEHLHR